MDGEDGLLAQMTKEAHLATLEELRARLARANGACELTECINARLTALSTVHVIELEERHRDAVSDAASLGAGALKTDAQLDAAQINLRAVEASLETLVEIRAAEWKRLADDAAGRAAHFEALTQIQTERQALLEQQLAAGEARLHDAVGDLRASTHTLRRHELLAEEQHARSELEAATAMDGEDGLLALMTKEAQFRRHTYEAGALRMEDQLEIAQNKLRAMEASLERLVDDGRRQAVCDAADQEQLQTQQHTVVLLQQQCAEKETCLRSAVSDLTDMGHRSALATDEQIARCQLEAHRAVQLERLEWAMAATQMRTRFHAQQVATGISHLLEMEGACRSSISDVLWAQGALIDIVVVGLAQSQPAPLRRQLEGMTPLCIEMERPTRSALGDSERSDREALSANRRAMVAECGAARANAAILAAEQQITHTVQSMSDRHLQATCYESVRHQLIVDEVMHRCSALADACYGREDAWNTYLCAAQSTFDTQQRRNNADRERASAACEHDVADLRGRLAEAEAAHHRTSSENHVLRLDVQTLEQQAAKLAEHLCSETRTAQERDEFRGAADQLALTVVAAEQRASSVEASARHRVEAAERHWHSWLSLLEFTVPVVFSALSDSHAVEANGALEASEFQLRLAAMSERHRQVSVSLQGALTVSLANAEHLQQRLEQSTSTVGPAAATVLGEHGVGEHVVTGERRRSLRAIIDAQSVLSLEADARAVVADAEQVDMLRLWRSERIVTSFNSARADHGRLMAESSRDFHGLILTEAESRCQLCNGYFVDLIEEVTQLTSLLAWEGDNRRQVIQRASHAPDDVSLRAAVATSIPVVANSRVFPTPNTARTMDHNHLSRLVSSADVVSPTAAPGTRPGDADGGLGGKAPVTNMDPVSEAAECLRLANQVSLLDARTATFSDVALDAALSWNKGVYAALEAGITASVTAAYRQSLHAACTAIIRSLREIELFVSGKPGVTSKLQSAIDAVAALCKGGSAHQAAFTGSFIIDELDPRFKSLAWLVSTRGPLVDALGELFKIVHTETNSSTGSPSRPGLTVASFCETSIGPLLTNILGRFLSRLEKVYLGMPTSIVAVAEMPRSANEKELLRSLHISSSGVSRPRHAPEAEASGEFTLTVGHDGHRLQRSVSSTETYAAPRAGGGPPDAAAPPPPAVSGNNNSTFSRRATATTTAAGGGSADRRASPQSRIALPDQSVRPPFRKSAMVPPLPSRPATSPSRMVPSPPSSRQ